MNNLDVINLRNKFDITQEELAKLVGVTRRTVANWELGRTIPEGMQKVLETISQQNEIEIETKKRKVNPDSLDRMLGIIENQLALLKDSQDMLKDTHVMLKDTHDVIMGLIKHDDIITKKMTAADVA